MKTVNVCAKKECVLAQVFLVAQASDVIRKPNALCAARSNVPLCRWWHWFDMVTVIFMYHGVWHMSWTLISVIGVYPVLRHGFVRSDKSFTKNIPLRKKRLHK